ncbi:CHASE domain-containing protein [Nannocystis radixulma]|uniref:histidine kinase n=1 Tax=Nannocystis radixulma TaxID=2995305 RepID=A0ABT5AY18_9BACT|nr:CHASE domain-containing protein [Nannocystis radixulma]MDC0666740.1 CHASE domain-containing protein [Nannocystis radixulma]
MGSRPSTTRTAWLPFALCLVLTGAAATLVGYAERQAERARLASAVLATRHRIGERMANYISMLRGSTGLPSCPEFVGAAEFHELVARLKLRDHYPGTQGVGYTARFGAVGPDEATDLAHAEGWDHVSVWPETPREEVHAIVLLEPLDVRNQAALGYDMRTESTRREAMDRARDEGDVALSGKVTLVQEIDADKQAGFLLYSPVYSESGVPGSLAERREKLKGYVYAPLRAGDLIEGIFGDEPPPVAFALYDGDTLDEEHLLYSFGRDIAPDDEVMVERVDIGGRVWTARFARATAKPRGLPLTLLVIGLGASLSIVVFAVTRARERARAHALTLATEEARANSEMLRFTDLFIGILGHDLRTPLNAIVLSAQMLERRAGDAGDSVQTLRRIRASGSRMSRMIDRLLDLTRVRLGGGIGVVVKPVALDAIVRDVVDEIVRADADARVEVEASGDLAGTWDPDRLAQVFSNLIGNAMRHRLDAPVRVCLRGTALDRVVATVHNAEAVAPARVPVLFEPFRSSGARPEHGASGLGLGLYISRAIVEAHGGSIAVAASEAEGTTFTVVLPRQTRR